LKMIINPPKADTFELFLCYRDLVILLLHNVKYRVELMRKKRNDEKCTAED